MTKKYTIHDCVVLIDVQYSKIGYGYPRIFVEVVPTKEYVMIDATVGAAFVMPAANWDAWFADAVNGTLEDIDEAGLSFDGLVKAVCSLKK